MMDDTGANLKGEREGFAAENLFNFAAGGVAAGTIFSPRNAVGVFGGKLGAFKSSGVADGLGHIRGGFDKALVLKERGLSPTEIWKETGWFRDVDSQWKFELPVSPTQLRDQELVLKLYNDDGPVVIGDLFPPSDPIVQDLFKLYPDLKSRPVRNIRGGRALGEYDPMKDTIAVNMERILEHSQTKNLNPHQQLKETLVHEIQHAIQQREKWWSGASPQTIQAQLMDTFRHNLYSTKLDKKLQKGYSDAIDFLLFMETSNSSAPWIEQFRRNLYRMDLGEISARTAQKRQTRLDLKKAPLADLFTREGEELVRQIGALDVSKLERQMIDVAKTSIKQRIEKEHPATDARMIAALQDDFLKDYEQFRQTMSGTFDDTPPIREIPFSKPQSAEDDFRESFINFFTKGGTPSGGPIEKELREGLLAFDSWRRSATHGVGQVVNKELKGGITKTDTDFWADRLYTLKDEDWYPAFDAYVSERVEKIEPARLLNLLRSGLKHVGKEDVIEKIERTIKIEDLAGVTKAPTTTN
jgi:hypothetical protein